MAQGYFRGCIYTVWYTPDIPSSFGPWKLNGCPGLILEATRDDKGFAFYATKINYEEKNISPQYSNKTDKITYTQLRRKQIDELNKKLENAFSQKSRNSNEDESTWPFVSITCLECDWLSEIKRYPGFRIKKIATEQDYKE
jgi:GLPGLI family protein